MVTSPLFVTTTKGQGGNGLLILTGICQDQIDEINRTITIYNRTLTFFKGEDGESSKAVNYTEEYVDYALWSNMILNLSLNNFSVSQDMMANLSENLTVIQNALNDLEPEIQELDLRADTILDDHQVIIDYIDQNYDLENTQEEDLDDIVQELIDDENFNATFDGYSDDYWEYIDLHDDVTDDFGNVTSLMFNRTRQLIEDLNDYEEVYPVDGPQDGPEGVPSVAAGGGITQEKLITHNDLRNKFEGCEVSIEKANNMDIDFIRFDFSWWGLHKNKDGVPFEWDRNPNDPNNYWSKKLDPTLREIAGYPDMWAIPVIKTFKRPTFLKQDYQDAWEDHWKAFKYNNKRKPKVLDGKQAALWGWYDSVYHAEGIGIHFTKEPDYFVSQLITELYNGALAGDYRITAWNILNEPNTIYPGPDNWQKISVPYAIDYKGKIIDYKVKAWFRTEEGRKSSAKDRDVLTMTFTTADMAVAMINTVKFWCNGVYQQCFGNTKTIINLYSFGRYWKSDNWKGIAGWQKLDVLGIDIYKDQHFRNLLGPQVRVEWNMNKIAHDNNQEWWVVEMPGAEGPGIFGGQARGPKASSIEGWAKKAAGYHHCGCIGFYRLWGDYSNQWRGRGDTFQAAYDVYTNPGLTPTVNHDRTGQAYWSTIKSL